MNECAARALLTGMWAAATPLAGYPIGKRARSSCRWHDTGCHPVAFRASLLPERLPLRSRRSHTTSRFFSSALRTIVGRIDDQSFRGARTVRREEHESHRCM